MNGLTTNVFGIADVRVTRCGYTGEDGFEVIARRLILDIGTKSNLSEKLLGMRPTLNLQFFLQSY